MWLVGELTAFLAFGLGAAGVRWVGPGATSELATKTVGLTLTYVGPILAVVMGLLALPALFFGCLSPNVRRMYVKGGAFIGLIPTGGCMFFVGVPPLPANAGAAIVLFFVFVVATALYVGLLLIVVGKQLGEDGG